MSYTVSARAITKSFGGRRALDGVDLDIEAGSVLALLGPNGAGKTTMVRILATLSRPDSGTATVAGHDLLADPTAVKRRVSLTGQFVALDEVLTGRENLQMMGRLLHLPRARARQRAAQLLTEFDLVDAADRRVGTYSGGMKRRLDVAISMIERPELLFLDEPTTGLDPRGRESLWATIGRLVEDGVTVLLTTQYLDEADRLADQVAVLDGGRIVARGTPDELKARLGGGVRVRLQYADQVAYRAAYDALDPVVADEQSLRLELLTSGTATDVRELLARLEQAGASARRVAIDGPSLDDVFLSLTGASSNASTLEVTR
jgi:ABC-2 type transport system ATP-binding protein